MVLPLVVRIPTPVAVVPLPGKELGAENVIVGVLVHPEPSLFMNTLSTQPLPIILLIPK